MSARVQEDVAGRLDLTFDDIGEQSLKNIARSVRVYRVRLATAENTPKVTPTDNRPALTLPDKPSIAVLPFQNMSGDPEQEYFADGMVEEIITALSRIRWLFVIARNSSFSYKGQSVDVKRIGRELGVRYVLEGSVRKAGRRVRITGQLIDAVTGTHLWADRFDGSLEDIFELQDKVAISIAGVIEPMLEAAETRGSAERPTNDLTAYDLYLRALPLSGHAFEKDRIAQALDLLRQAIKRDARYGPALALAAMCHHVLDTNGWADDRETNRRMGVDLARQALRVGGDDPGVLARAAFVLARFGEDIDAAIALVDRSLVLNPSFAFGWASSGYIRLFAGQPDLSIEHFGTALRLSPRDRKASYLMGLGMAQFMARRFEEASATLQLSLQELPSYANTHRFLAACYAQMGRLDEAREVVKRLRVITPSVMPNLTTYWNREQRELYLDGLRLAAGEVDNP